MHGCYPHDFTSAFTRRCMRSAALVRRGLHPPPLHVARIVRRWVFDGLGRIGPVGNSCTEDGGHCAGSCVLVAGGKAQNEFVPSDVLRQLLNRRARRSAEQEKVCCGFIAIEANRVSSTGALSSARQRVESRKLHDGCSTSIISSSCTCAYSLHFQRDVPQRKCGSARAARPSFIRTLHE